MFRKDWLSGMFLNKKILKKLKTIRRFILSELLSSRINERLRGKAPSPAIKQSQNQVKIAILKIKKIHLTFLKSPENLIKFRQFTSSVKNINYGLARVLKIPKKETQMSVLDLREIQVNLNLTIQAVSRM